MSIGPYDHLGMSDDELRDEHKAQELVHMAKKILIEAARHTSIMGDEIRDSLDALPNIQCWNDEIRDARVAA